ncbi:hypothetical protein BJX64DRAFT_250208 [Aspergillus heterothallicus]
MGRPGLLYAEFGIRLGPIVPLSFHFRPRPLILYIALFSSLSELCSNEIESRSMRSPFPACPPVDTSLPGKPNGLEGQRLPRAAVPLGARDACLIFIPGLRLQ